MAKKIKTVAIVGPTASGKSSLAMSMAQIFGGEIISCDSMQVYRKMDIGTAKPTAEERKLVKHRMIDVADPDVCFSCADYVRMAHSEIENTVKDGCLPIICGGTGLYLDALLRGNDFEETQTDLTLRRELEDYASKNGNEALHEMLKDIDPESAEAIHPNNVKRVIRAIEIYRTSGVRKSELDRRSLLSESRYDAFVIGLRYPDRELLYRRIDSRVDDMLDRGLLAETEQLCRDGIFDTNTTAAQAIGYKELLGYLRGDMSLDDAVASLKNATRKYAKRQMTWFNSKKYVNWVDLSDTDGPLSFEEIVNYIRKLFLKNGFCDTI